MKTHAFGIMDKMGGEEGEDFAAAFLAIFFHPSIRSEESPLLPGRTTQKQGLKQTRRRRKKYDLRLGKTWLSLASSRVCAAE